VSGPAVRCSGTPKCSIISSSARVRKLSHSTNAVHQRDISSSEFCRMVGLSQNERNIDIAASRRPRGPSKEGRKHATDAQFPKTEMRSSADMRCRHSACAIISSGSALWSCILRYEFMLKVLDRELAVCPCTTCMPFPVVSLNGILELQQSSIYGCSRDKDLLLQCRSNLGPGDGRSFR